MEANNVLSEMQSTSSSVPSSCTALLLATLPEVQLSLSELHTVSKGHFS